MSDSPGPETNTIICPMCGAENLASAMNCRQCRINLQFALENPQEIERLKQAKSRTGPQRHHHKLPRPSHSGCLLPRRAPGASAGS